MHDTEPASPQWMRLVWAAVAGAALSVLVIARALEPDFSGMGTHVQLGLPPCGFLQLTTLPCPTCGLTTSFAHMARLQFTAALYAHWLGPPLFVLTVITVGLAAWGCATAMPIAAVMKRLRVARLLAIIGAAAVAIWLLRLAAIVLA